jgi:Rieske Fe-S protein
MSGNGSTPSAHDTTAAGDAGEGADMTRKEFLTAATIGVGGLMGALIAVPVAGMALSPAVKGTDFVPVKLKFEDSSIKSIDDLDEGTYYKAILNPGADTPDGYVRKRVAFVRKNKSKSDDELAPSNQWQYTVISNRCVHLGCPVTQQGEGFVCPCHGGAYSEDGARIAGPPVRPLDRFRWELRDNELWAVGQYSLTPKGKVVDQHGPGQHTGMPQGLFYPLQP